MANQRTWLRSWRARIEQIGADPADGSELALRKRPLVLLSFAVIPAAVIWSAVYFIAGARLAVLAPGLYAVIVPLNTAVFAARRKIGLYRFSQLFLILALPFFLMLALGGYQSSSSVILWAALAPLGSLLLEELRYTIGWIVGFVALLVVGAALRLASESLAHQVVGGAPRLFGEAARRLPLPSGANRVLPLFHESQPSPPPRRCRGLRGRRARSAR